MVISQHDGTRSVGGGGGGDGGGGGGDETVYTVTVSGVGYRNEGYKDDGTDGIPPEPQKPPQLSSTDDDTQSRKFKLSRGEKWRILKNIGTVSVAFMVQFTAFQGTANLQSSINASDGLGTVSLSAIYAALVLSCIFVPTFLIKRLTVKWTLCLSMLCYAPYIGSQFYPKFYTLVPAGVLLGLGAAPMWAAQATYLTQVGGVYAKLTDQPVDAIVVRFFGFFFLAWQTAELWGNLISSLGKRWPYLFIYFFFFFTSPLFSFSFGQTIALYSALFALKLNAKSFADFLLFFSFARNTVQVFHFNQM